MTDEDKRDPDRWPDLKDFAAKAAAQDGLADELFAGNKLTVFAALAAAGIDQVTVDFDGYADSGQIEGMAASSGGAAVTLPLTGIEIAVAIWGKPEPERRTVPLSEAIEQLAYDLLSRTHPGWENNNGAFGDFLFDVPGGTITLDCRTRYVTCDSDVHEF